MLETALASFRAQSFRDAEALIVNDGIPIASRSPDVRVLNLPPGIPISIGEKRNAGLRGARGEWVATWDDDDLSLPSRLSELFDALEGGRIKYVRSATMWVADATMRVVALCSGCCYPTALFHRKTALRIGGFSSDSYGEDSVFFQRLVAAGERWSDRLFRSYVHRRHGTNVSALICGESLQGFLARAIATPVNEITAVQAVVDDLARAAVCSIHEQSTAVPMNGR
jgi:glycosyltransferase involved in cell wall biosynthesis